MVRTRSQNVYNNDDENSEDDFTHSNPNKRPVEAEDGIRHSGYFYPSDDSQHDEAIYNVFKKQKVQQLKRKMRTFLANEATKVKKQKVVPSDIGAFSRFSIKYFNHVIRTLSDHQRDVIEEYGFGCLLKLNCTSVPLKLVKWISRHVDVRTSEIIFKDKIIPFNKQCVKTVLDLPFGGEEFIADSDAGRSLLFSKFQLSSVPQISFFANMLKSKEGLSDDMIFSCFMIVALSSFLCPNSNIHPSTKYLHLLNDPKSAKKYDWCKFVYDWLMKSVSKFNNSKKTSGKKSNTLGGCHYFLAVKYLDYLNFGQLELEGTVPRTLIWTNNLISKYAEYDVVNGVSFGRRPLKEFESTCYYQANNSSNSKNLGAAKSVSSTHSAGPLGLDPDFKAKLDLCIGESVSKEVKDSINLLVSNHSEHCCKSSESSCENLIIDVIKLLHASSSATVKSMLHQSVNLADCPKSDPMKCADADAQFFDDLPNSPLRPVNHSSLLPPINCDGNHSIQQRTNVHVDNEANNVMVDRVMSKLAKKGAVFEQANEIANDNHLISSDLNDADLGKKCISKIATLGITPSQYPAQPRFSNSKPIRTPSNVFSDRINVQASNSISSIKCSGLNARRTESDTATNLHSSSSNLVMTMKTLPFTPCTNDQLSIPKDNGNICSIPAPVSPAVHVASKEIIDVPESSPDVQIIASKTFNDKCKEIAKELDQFHNNNNITQLNTKSKQSPLERLHSRLLPAKSGDKHPTSSANKLPDRPPRKRVIYPSSSLVSPYVAQTGRFMVSQVERRHYNAICQLTNSHLANSPGFQVTHTYATYNSMGTSLCLGGLVDNFFMNAYCRHFFDKLHPGISKKHHFFNFIGGSILDYSGDTEHKMVAYAFAGAGAAHKLHLSDTLYFPIVKSGHWFLFIVDLANYLYVFLDSLFDEGSEFQRHVKSILIDTFQELWDLLVGVPVDWSRFTPHYPVRPKQIGNTSDCGIFVMKYMELWSPRVNLLNEFSQADIPNIRIKYANQLYFSQYNKVDKSPVLNFYN